MTCYISVDGAMYLTYLNGMLLDIVIQTGDLVLFDGLKHHIALYEDHLRTDLFRKQQRG